jgi:tetratricopeptide (TPR) repeat protein/TolB-like protein
MRTSHRSSIYVRRESMSAVEKHQIIRLPIDSIAVVARSAGGVRADVLAELLENELAAALARSRTLRVPRAEFVRPYAKSEMTPEEIGRALNVRGVVLCTVATSGACIDASVDVIDVVREELVAHDAFLVSSREVPALERAIFRAIPGHGRVPPPSKCPPLAQVIEARVALANGDAERALEILGDSAPVETAATIIAGRLSARIDEARQALRAVPGCVRALQLQAKLASRFDGDWRGAERALREALEIDPGSPSTHAMLGDVLLAMRRRDEAAPHHRLVAELMPVDASAQIAASFADYFGPCPIDAAPRLAALPEANDWLVRALVAGGDVLGAQQAAATPFGRALLAAFTGDDFSIASFTACERALLFSAAGAAEQAIACLESAADVHADEVIFAAVEPLFAPLAGEARFLALLSRLGL